MEPFPHNADSHNNHDDKWCVVSGSSGPPLCLACLVDHLEDHSLRDVQQQFNLSMLASVLEESNETIQLLRDHSLVCQHMLGIITDYYTNNNFLTMSAKICVQLMSVWQSEEMYVDLLDKLQKQAQTNTGIPFVTGVLARLSQISSTHVLTLIVSHGHLLLHLLESLALDSSPQTESSVCSLLFLLIHLFDDDVLPVVPPPVFSVVENFLVSKMKSAQSLDLQKNSLNDSECWPDLLQAFKRLFVGKKETLVTASTQCLVILFSSPRHGQVHELILESDIAEFVFESLHTMNTAQLGAAFRCLHLFSKHDLFFSKLHAVYGLESVLRALDITLETHNVVVLERGFNLLSSVLQRQPNSIPLFVNKSAVELTMSVIAKGASCHAVQAVVPALHAATALLRYPKASKQLPSESVKTVLQAALSKVGSVVWRGEIDCVLPNFQLTEHQLLNTVLAFLTAAIESLTDDHMFKCVTEECCTNILPYCSGQLETCDNTTVLNMLHLLNCLYAQDETSLQGVSERAVSSGLVFQLMRKKPDFRSELELLTTVNDFVVNVFRVLVKEDTPHCQSLPDCLNDGLGKVSFKSSMQDTVDEIWEEEAATALCMVLYFSCRKDTDTFSPSQVLHALQALATKGVLKCASDKPLIPRFLLYLMAWTSEQLEKEADYSSELLVVETIVVEEAQRMPVELWATPHPQVFLWLFQTDHRAQGLGTSLLEHWLVHTKGSIPTINNEPLRSHVVCTLFHNHNFRAVLLKLMESSSEEMSFLSRKLVIALITMPTEEDEKVTHLVSSMHDEVMSRFQSLFIQSVHPSCHAVNNFLQTMAAVIQHPMYVPSGSDQNKVIKVIYHVVSHISKVNSDEDEILYNGMACLLALSKSTEEENDLTVVPILLQNASFIRQINTCVHSNDKRMSYAALSVAAWMSSCPIDCQIDTPINISVDFLLQIVTDCDSQCAVAVLKVLFWSLVSNTSGVTRPLTFYKSHNLIQSISLYSAYELRQLFCYVQQYVCSDSKEIQSCAVQCLLAIIEHSTDIDKTLGEHFLHHPWNCQLLHLLLSNSASSGLDLHIAEFVHKVWCEDDAEIAKLVLETVLLSDVTLENQDFLLSLSQKELVSCTAEVYIVLQANGQCHDSNLADRARHRLAAFESSQSFSQNTDMA